MNHVVEKFERDLGRGLLASVSRSFYLSLRVLPAKLRTSISLAYLLARATDTVADTAALPLDERRRFLDRFAAVINGEIDPRLEEDLAERVEPHQVHEGEQVLIERFTGCIAWLDAVSGSERTRVRDVLGKIVVGQRIDLETFGAGDGVRAFETGGELDRYTYLVAGSVGEFWTRTCRDELSRCFRNSEDETVRWAIDYGKGLQLVNILRDLPGDLEQGRCYLPREDWGASGLKADDLAGRPEVLGPALKKWQSACRGFLTKGEAYVSAVRARRVRFASAVPLLLAKKTLDQLERSTWEERRAGIKVSRGQVNRSLARAMMLCLKP